MMLLRKRTISLGRATSTRKCERVKLKTMLTSSSSISTASTSTPRGPWTITRISGAVRSASPERPTTRPTM